MLLGAISFLLASCIGRILCALQNISIDDQNGDPVTGQEIQYSKNWSFGPTCTKCEAKVNPPNEPFDQSWHDSTFLTNGPLLTASVTFTGRYLLFVRD